MRERIGILILGCCLLIACAVLAILQKQTDCVHSMVVQRVNVKFVQGDFQFYACSSIDPVKKKSQFSYLKGLKPFLSSGLAKGPEALQVQARLGDITLALHGKLAQIDAILKSFKTFPRGIELTLLTELNTETDQAIAMTEDGLYPVVMGVDQILAMNDTLQREILKIAMRSHFPDLSEVTHVALIYLFLDVDAKNEMKNRSWISVASARKSLSPSELGDFVGVFIASARNSLPLGERYNLLKNWRVMGHEDVVDQAQSENIDVENIAETIDRVLLELESVAILNPGLKAILGALDAPTSLGFYSSRR